MRDTCKPGDHTVIRSINRIKGVRLGTVQRCRKWRRATQFFRIDNLVAHAVAVALKLNCIELNQIKLNQIKSN